MPRIYVKLGFLMGTMGSLNGVPGIADAAVTVTTSLTSDFMSRGETQTENAPAIQMTANLAQALGSYEGVFVSNVNFGNSSMYGDPQLEVKPFLGYVIQISGTTSIDVGTKYYTYLLKGGAAYNYGAVYANLSADWLKVGGAYAPNYDGRSSPEHLGAWYAFGEVAVPLDAHVYLLSHVGCSFGEYWTRVGDGRQSDYSIGFSYSTGRYSLLLQYVGRVIVGEGTGLANNEARTVISIQTRFSLP